MLCTQQPDAWPSGPFFPFPVSFCLFLVICIHGVWAYDLLWGKTWHLLHPFVPFEFSPWSTFQSANRLRSHNWILLFARIWRVLKHPVPSGKGSRSLSLPSDSLCHRNSVLAKKPHSAPLIWGGFFFGAWNHPYAVLQFKGWLQAWVQNGNGGDGMLSEGEKGSIWALTEPLYTLGIFPLSSWHLGDQSGKENTEPKLQIGSIRFFPKSPYGVTSVGLAGIPASRWNPISD